jgi:hypothetical protein
LPQREYLYNESEKNYKSRLDSLYFLLPKTGSFLGRYLLDDISSKLWQLQLFPVIGKCPQGGVCGRQHCFLSIENHWSNLSLTKELKIHDGEIAASSTNTAGKTG